MAKNGEDAAYKSECGARLRILREALEYPKARAFAADTGTDEDNLSNWERGVALVPALYVRRLKGLFRITFDWIYDGDASGMPRDLARKIATTDRRRA